MARTRDERRLDGLAAGERLDQECSCGHTRALHGDDWSDALLVGNGACCGWAIGFIPADDQPCQCRGGDYPRAEDEVNDRRAEGAWGAW